MPWVDSRQQAILKKARACLARQQAESDPSTARDDEDGQQPDEFFLPSRQPNKQGPQPVEKAATAVARQKRKLSKQTVPAANPPAKKKKRKTNLDETCISAESASG